jgi:hypothetical protein
MGEGFWAGVFGITAAIVSLAVIATLVRNAGGTAQIIQSATGGFADTLRAAQGA